MVAYHLRRDNLFHEDVGYYQSYGIDAVDASSNNIIRSVKDISVDMESVKSLVECCNRLHLDVVQLDEIVADHVCRLHMV